MILNLSMEDCRERSFALSKVMQIRCGIISKSLLSELFMPFLDSYFYNWLERFVRALTHVLILLNKYAKLTLMNRLDRYLRLYMLRFATVQTFEDNF